jgi:PST family polysaccharide transporter
MRAKDLSKKKSLNFQIFWERFSHVLNNSFWLLIEKLNRAILGLVVGAWLARYLGPTGYGQLTYALTYIMFFQSIVNLGTDGIVVRDLVKEPAAAHEILGTTLSLRIVTGLLFWVISIIYIQVINGWNLGSLWFYALFGSIVFFQAFDTIDLWFQSQNQSKKTAWAKLAAHTISNLSKVIFILLHAKLELFAICFALDGLLTALGLYLNYKHTKTKRKWIYQTNRAKLILKESWPYILSGMSVMLYMRIGQFIIDYELGDHELGIYAVAMPLSQIWYVIPMALATNLAPYISAQKARGEKEYIDSLLVIFRCFGILGVFISITVLIFSDKIVNFFYGPTYSSSADILAINIFSTFFVFQGVAQNLWIINESKGLYQTCQSILGVISSLIANYLLIPKFGLIGAASASVISYAVSSVLVNFFFNRKIFLMQLGIRPRNFN